MGNIEIVKDNIPCIWSEIEETSKSGGKFLSFNIAHTKSAFLSVAIRQLPVLRWAVEETSQAELVNDHCAIESLLKAEKNSLNR